MQRVTSQLVREAFHKTGYIPTIGFGTAFTACPLKAVQEAFELEWPEGYMYGFIAGYESLKYNHEDADNYQLGLQDGRLVAVDVPPMIWG